VQLVWNWKAIVKRAWSMRLMLLATVFSGLEVALPLLDGVLPVSKGVFAGLCGLTVVIAMWARLIYQPNVRADL
jgi:hypothetical protein